MTSFLSLSPLFQSLICAFVSFLGILTIYFLAFWSFKKQQVELINTLTKAQQRTFHWPVFFLSLSLSFFIPLEYLGAAEKTLGLFQSLLTIFLIASISWFLIRAVRVMKFLVLRRYDLNEKDNLKARKVYTQFRLLERIAIVIILVLAISLSLMTFESIRQIGVSLIASAGLAGIILGLAAQKIIGSVLAGIQIAIAQPIRLGDAVVVEGEWGWVEEINLTYVVIKIWDKRRLVVPTTYFIEKPFQNWTRTSSDILGTVFLLTDYHLPVEEMRTELNRILSQTDLWNGKTGIIQVTNATEKGMELRILVSADDSPTAWDLRVLVREQLIAYLQQTHPEALPRLRIELPASDPSPGEET